MFDTPAKGGNVGDSEDITSGMPWTRQDEQRPLKLTVDEVSAGGSPVTCFFDLLSQNTSEDTTRR